MLNEDAMNYNYDNTDSDESVKVSLVVSPAKHLSWSTPIALSHADICPTGGDTAG